MDHLLTNLRDKNGLFSRDWNGQKDNEYKGLLDKASLVEIWATLAEFIELHILINIILKVGVIQYARENYI